MHAPAAECGAATPRVCSQVGEGWQASEEDDEEEQESSEEEAGEAEEQVEEQGVMQGGGQPGPLEAGVLPHGRQARRVRVRRRSAVFDTTRPAVRSPVDESSIIPGELALWCCQQGCCCGAACGRV